MENKLSKQELRIAELVGLAFSDKQIADILCISAGTVKVHKTNIFEKLELTKSIELAHWSWCLKSGEKFDLPTRRDEYVNQLQFNIEEQPKKIKSRLFEVWEYFKSRQSLSFR